MVYNPIHSTFRCYSWRYISFQAQYRNANNKITVNMRRKSEMVRCNVFLFIFIEDRRRKKPVCIVVACYCVVDVNATFRICSFPQVYPLIIYCFLISLARRSPRHLFAIVLHGFYVICRILGVLLFMLLSFRCVYCASPTIHNFPIAERTFLW